MILNKFIHLIKIRFHKDLAIRYQKQIAKGRLRLIPRQSNSLWEYIKWTWQQNWQQNIRPLLPMMICFLFFLIVIKLFAFSISHYKNTCQINYLGYSISPDIISNFGFILAIILLLMSVLLTIKPSYQKYQQEQDWFISLIHCNRYYIVQKRHSPIFRSLQRIGLTVFVFIILLLFIISVINFWQYLSQPIIQHGGLSQLNQAWIEQCLQKPYVQELPH